MANTTKTGLALVLMLVSTVAAPQADEGYADVYSVDPVKYFDARRDGLAIAAADRLELVRQYAHELQLMVERWSVDNSPPQRLVDAPNDGQGLSTYPTYDKLHYELNHWDPQYGSYSGAGKKQQGAGYFPNPYTGKSARVRDALAIPFGWTPEAAGNFSYAYQLDEFGMVIRYALIFYTDRADAGLNLTGDDQPDGVELVLSGGTDASLVQPLAWLCADKPIDLRLPTP